MTLWNINAIEKLSHRLPKDIPLSLQDLPAELELFSDGRISIYYAPVGFVNPRAKVAIVGLTPGWQQARFAYQAAIDAIRNGTSPVEAHRMRKPWVAFAGSMRRNLIRMLDELRLHEHLDIRSTADLFGTSALHATSALRFPVFCRGRNYSGSSPKPTKHPELLEMIDRILAPELATVSRALIIPLGLAVSECLSRLCNHGQLQEARCLFGFPHPSGANGHRTRQFEAAKRELRKTLRLWFDGKSA
jgi:uracil-DNA glycosylase